jgi:hypothetical protein
MKKSISWVIMSVVIICLLVACGKGSNENSIVGKWENDNGVVEFKSDGTMILSEEEMGMSIDGKYEIKDGKLIIEMIGMEEEVEFELKGNKLIVEDEEFTRK